MYFKKMTDKIIAFIPILKKEMSDFFPPIFGAVTLPLSFLPPIQSIIQTVILAIIGAITGVLTKIIWEKLFLKKKSKSKAK